jgi:hypothetical protein
MTTRHMLQLTTMAVASLFTFGARANAVENGDHQAFFQGRDAFVELQAEPPASDASVRWAASVRALAQSESPAADAYLVELGLFKLDGEAGSEYSCAMSKRTKRISALMRRQLTIFANDNACRRFAVARKLDAQKLCATKKEFARRVEQSRNVPLPDREGACSY